jgi:hypothetical protein
MSMVDLVQRNMRKNKQKVLNVKVSAWNEQCGD